MRCTRLDIVATDQSPAFAIAWDEIQVWQLSTEETLWGARIEILLSSGPRQPRRLLHGLVGLLTEPNVAADAGTVDIRQLPTVYATKETTTEELNPWVERLRTEFIQKVKAMHADLH